MKTLKYGTTVALVVLAFLLGMSLAAIARGAEFSPVPANVNGAHYTDNLNAMFGGTTAQQPQLSCTPLVYLPRPPAFDHQLTVCHNCAPTNPCTAGTRDIVAVATGSDWDCNTSGSAVQSINAQSQAFVDVAIGSALTDVLAAPLALAPDSPTGTWLVRYEVTALLAIGAGKTCDVILTVDGTPVAAATAGLASAETVPVTVTYVDRRTAGVDTFTTAKLQVQGSASSACTVKWQSVTAAAPATWVRMTATPGG